MHREVSRFLKKIDREVTRSKPGSTERILLETINDLVNPIDIDWQLDESDKHIISAYVALFIQENSISVESMKTPSPECSQSLHNFISALKGELSWQEFMAAFDYLEKNWPELKSLFEESE